MGFRSKLEKLTRAIVRVVTAVLLTVGLVFVYFVGLPLTLALTALFSPRRLFSWAGRGEPRWFDVDERGHGPDMDEALRQS